MKVEGFNSKIIKYSELETQMLQLPEDMSMWGKQDNFEILNYDSSEIKIFLLYYYETIVGGIAYYQKNLRNIINTAYSPHYNLSVPYAHIYLAKQDSQRATEQLLKEFFTRFTKEVACNSDNINLHLSPDILDVRELVGQGWDVTPQYTYILDLDGVRSKGLSEYVGKKVRNIIKYAKLELEVRQITPKEMYICYKDTYAKQGKTCPKPEVFFFKLSKLNNVKMFGAFINNEIVSGVAICEWGDTAYYLTSGVINKYYNSNGTTLLLYEYIESILNNAEIKWFDFVGANNENVSYFKSCFQPSSRLYFNVKKQSYLFKILNAMNSSITNMTSYIRIMGNRINMEDIKNGNLRGIQLKNPITEGSYA